MICQQCGSAAINDSLHGRQKGIDLDYCDVCYWRFRAEDREKEIRRLRQGVLAMCIKCRVVSLKDCKKCFALKIMSQEEAENAMTTAERGEG